MSARQPHRHRDSTDDPTCTIFYTPTWSRLQRAVTHLRSSDGERSQALILTDYALRRRLLADCFTVARLVDVLAARTMAIRTNRYLDRYDVTFIAPASRPWRFALGQWLRAEPLGWKMPGLNELNRSVRQTFGRERWLEFDAIVRSTISVRRYGPGLDITAVMLLIAARGNCRFVEIREWLCKMGLASEGTVAKRKRQLEMLDVVLSRANPADTPENGHRLTTADPLFDHHSIVEVTRAVGNVLRAD